MKIEYSPIKLGQLINYMEEPTEVIQIVTGADWDRYSEIPMDSPLLKPFYGYTIRDLEAVSMDCIRVSLDMPS